MRSLGPWLPLLLLPNLVADALPRRPAGGSAVRPPRRAPALPPAMSVRLIGDALMLGLPSGSVRLRDGAALAAEAPLRRADRARHRRHRRPEVLRGPLARPVPRARDALGLAAARARLARPRSAAAGCRPCCCATALGAGGGRAAAGHRDGARADGRPAAARARPLRRSLDGLLARAQRAALPAHRRRRSPRSSAGPGGCGPRSCSTWLGWFVRSLETLLFLRLLGVDAPLAAAMVIETALILVRALAVPVPAGLGVQDLGYVLSLRGARRPRPRRPSAPPSCC